MGLTRRQFIKRLGAAACLLPFMPGIPRAATGPVRRLVVVTSIGVPQVHWLPKSAGGAPLVLPPAFASLQPVIDHVVYAPGLGWAVSPTENHSSPQTLTGRGSGNGFSPQSLSIDQFIAGQIKPSTKYPTFLLGVNEALIESHHFSGGQRLTPMINPVEAFQQAFGVGAPAAAAPAAPSAAAAPATTMPRDSILQIVGSQIKDVQKSLGKKGRGRLDQHLASLAALEANLKGTTAGGAGGMAAGCSPGAAPNLGGLDPSNNDAMATMAAGHLGIAANVLSCDISRIVGMQFGKSNTAFCQYAAGAGIDEHSAVHNPGSAEFVAKLLQCDAYIGKWVADLATTLKATPDPLNPNSTMLDNTLIAWIRDMGDADVHLQYALPYALIGGTGYLATATGGALRSFSGNNSAATVGPSHQRLLLNLAEYMGVTDFSAFGDFTKVGPAMPLAELKA